MVCNRGLQRRIVIGYDGSPASLRSIEWTVTNLHRSDDVLIITHISDSSEITSIPPVYRKVSATGTVLLDEIGIFDGNNGLLGPLRIFLDKLITSSGKNIECVYYEVVSQSPGQALVDLCRDHLASILVVGKRRLGVIRRLFLGSVSEYN